MGRRHFKLERENARLKKLVAEQALGQGDSRGGAQGKLLSPERRRQAVRHVQSELEVGLRRLPAARSI